MFEGLWCFFVFSFGLLFLFVFLCCFRLDAFFGAPRLFVLCALVWRVVHFSLPTPPPGCGNLDDGPSVRLDPEARPGHPALWQGRPAMVYPTKISLP